jgi:hypothetical protein
MFNYAKYSELLVVLISKITPRLVWALRRRSMKSLKLTEPLIVVSCDCDTDEDTAAVLEIDTKFSQIGITPEYAVPGEVLVRGSSTYLQLHGRGRKFLNHGYFDHVTVLSNKPAENTFLYSDLSVFEIEDDMARGHTAIKDLFGSAPTGWRTPHFGSFEKRSQLKLIATLGKKFGYTYSSSSTGFHSLKHGQIDLSGFTAEIPITGHGSAGLGVLDSWSFLRNKADSNSFDSPAFFAELRQIINRFEGINFLLNIYLDPRFLPKTEIFWDELRRELIGIRSVSFEEVLEKVRKL